MVDTLPVRTQANLLGISRTHLYYQPVPPSAREVAIKHRIDEVFATSPYANAMRASNQLVIANRLIMIRPARLHPDPDDFCRSVA